MKLIDAVERAQARLLDAGVGFGHGTTNAYDEAAWLVLWRLGLPLDGLHAQAERVLDDAELASVRATIEQRIATRKPAAYLTGEAWLQGVPFFVDERVIVPRSLIAEPLMDGTFDPWVADAHQGQPGMGACDVLDLCTGNGSLAILAALAWPHARIDAAELSVDALAVAQINVQRHNLSERVRLHLGDGLSAVAGRRYQVILCNPPYVNTASMRALPTEYRHEPVLALAGGDDGMDFVRRLLPAVGAALNDDGVLVLEIGHEVNHFDDAFSDLEVIWIETSGGPYGVGMITAQALRAWAPARAHLQP